MGQEQSTPERHDVSTLQAHDGFRVVQPSSVAGHQGGDDLAGEAIMKESQQIFAPSPVLPPSPVPDNKASALTGGLVMFELRNMFGGLLGELNPSANTSEDFEEGAPEGGENEVEPSSRVDGAGVNAERGSAGVDDSTIASGGADQSSSTAPKRPPSRQGTRGAEPAEPLSVSDEQALWAGKRLSSKAIKRALNGCAGGEPLRLAVKEQERLCAQVEVARTGALRVRHAMEATEKEAVRTRKALESLERLRMMLADVQDSLEAELATANILGAAHFPHDDEMRSFKAYLHKHPPLYESAGSE